MNFHEKSRYQFGPFFMVFHGNYQTLTSSTGHARQFLSKNANFREKRSELISRKMANDCEIVWNVKIDSQGVNYPFGWVFEIPWNISSISFSLHSASEGESLCDLDLSFIDLIHSDSANTDFFTAAWGLMFIEQIIEDLQTKLLISFIFVTFFKTF